MKNKLILSAIAIILGSCTSQNTNNMEAGMVSSSNNVNVSYQKQLLDNVDTYSLYNTKIYLITIDGTKVLWVCKAHQGGDALMKLN